MRERDLERATKIFSQMKKLEECFMDHEKSGRYLRLLFELPRVNVVDGGKEVDWADVAAALALNPDSLHARANLLIRAMLEETMTNHKAELRKLGIKLEADEVPVPAKKEKKQKLLPAPANGGK